MTTVHATADITTTTNNNNNTTTTTLVPLKDGN